MPVIKGQQGDVVHARFLRLAKCPACGGDMLRPDAWSDRRDGVACPQRNALRVDRFNARFSGQPCVCFIVAKG
ncbi:hypothetical protein AA0243_2106 [Novacetimonas hansenii NRIC 0243]|nr:hypothetical protein AA0243_2106 [Novacetimonas hansenii NRIC 0243]